LVHGVCGECEGRSSGKGREETKVAARERTTPDPDRGPIFRPCRRTVFSPSRPALNALELDGLDFTTFEARSGDEVAKVHGSIQYFKSGYSRVRGSW
jgi:hypothetical protein